MVVSPIELISRSLVLYTEKTKSLAEKQKRVNAALETMGQDLGAMLLGPAADFTEWVTDLLPVFDRLAPKMQGVIDKIAGLHDAASEDGGAAEWLGTGTALDSLVDAWNAVNDAVTPTDLFADRMQLELQRAEQLAGYVNELMPLASSLGATADELKVVARAAIDAGWTVGQLRDALVEAGATIEDSGGTVEDLRKELLKLPPTAKEFEKALGSLAGITKTSLKSARDEARVGMAQFAWAMKHPLAEDKLADFYENQVVVWGRRARRAQRRHNELAYAQAVANRDRFKELLSSVQQAVVTIRTKWAASPIGRPGAKFEAKASGGPVGPYSLSLVGERGPELLQMGGRGGNIVPNAGRRPHPTVIYLDGRVIYDNVNRRMGRDIALNGSF